jgi:hypothetical protein
MHNNAGASTIRFAADPHVGLGGLVSYASAGDFEGYVTYGLGIQVAPGSDQVREIRAGQQTRPDGAGDVLYVVAFDVRSS